MPKKLRSLDDTPLDVFEALKRALIRRGFIRQQPKPKKIKPKLFSVTEKSHDILYRANTVFPFTLFPNTVTLDREKLTFATRYFFRLAKITSVPVRDILSVEANVGLLFGSVHTASRYFITNPYTVNYLWRGDAVNLQRLLQGYIIAHEQQIDCSSIERNQLVAMLEDLGKGASD